MSRAGAAAATAEVAGATAVAGTAAGVRLRDMSWRDIPQLAALDAELFGTDAWSEATWWSELAGRPRRDYVVAVTVDDGERAASAAGTAYREPTRAEPAAEENALDEKAHGEKAHDEKAHEDPAYRRGAVDGPVVGYAGLDHGGEVADVMTLAVVPARRGTGLGDRLVAELTRRARARGAQALMLEVRADNAAAIRLYRRHGLEQVGVRRRYYEPGGVDALVLRRRIGAP